MLEVELALDELLDERLIQFGIRGRIARAKVINRLDQADAQVMPADAVDHRAGEILVLRIRDPVHQRHTRIVAGLDDPDVRAIERTRGEELMRPRLAHANSLLRQVWFL